MSIPNVGGVIALRPANLTIYGQNFMDKNLLTRKDAAALLGLAPQTLAKWSMTGKNLSVIRLSERCVRYSRTEIDAFIERCTATGSSLNDNLGNIGDHE